MFVSYDADKSRLTATIGGEELYFTVNPERAKALHDRWREIKVLQHYDDDESHARFPTEAANLDPVSGVSPAIAEKLEKDRLEADATRKAQEDTLAAQRARAEAAKAASENAAGPDPAQAVAAVDQQFRS